MDQKQLYAIKERVAKATPGEWRYLYVGHNKTEHSVVTAEEYVAHTYDVNDAEFIAHARKDVPALVAEVERLQNRCELYELAKRNDKKTIEQISEFNEKTTTDLFKRMDQNGKLAKQYSDAVKEIERLRKALEEIMEDQAPIMEGWETTTYEIARKALGGEAK
ncbi:hypothetical protein [Lysinibacillus fusiformis]